MRPFNERAIRCYRNAGFVDAGTRTIHPSDEDVEVRVMALELPTDGQMAGMIHP